MNPRKEELRNIVLDIVFGREKVFYGATQFGHLTAGVAEVLGRRHGDKQSSESVFPRQERLEYNDLMIVQEIFWDLVVERVLTIGMNSDNAEYPWFRLHSEATANLKRQ